MKKKLIEVALPLEAINAASAREKSIRHGHPSTLHLWWARRPLAAARAVIFAQMVDDPSANPDLFPTEKAQEKERQRLFRIIEDLVKWENTTNEEVLERARTEIWQSWRRACAENADHPRAHELFDRHKLPAFHDPFAGGGALPLEAQRLGLESYASDLNPVAVLINKAMIEIPPRFAARPPVNPAARNEKNLFAREWKGAQGLADDVRYYGQWMRDEAQKRIGHLYPPVEITDDMAQHRPDLKPYVGKKLTVIAWLWARTVKCPNPGCSARTPLVRSFWLSTKKGKQTYAHPELNHRSKSVDFSIRSTGEPLEHTTDAKGARCLFCHQFIKKAELRQIASEHGTEPIPMAIVCEGDRGRIYLPPSAQTMSKVERPEADFLDHPMTNDRRWFSPPLYGLPNFADLFTPRQLVALTTFSDLVQEAREQARRDALAASMPDDGKGLAEGGSGARAYSEAVGVYLGFALSRSADRGSSICSWDNSPKMEALRNTFGRQAIPMVWDFAEGNPFSESSGNWSNNVEWGAKALVFMPSLNQGEAGQFDATKQDISSGKITSTDPPYYDNIGYADLSDFFYVWLRRSLKVVFPDLLATLAVPKSDELVATPYRHGSKEKAETFFLEGMTQAMNRLATQAHPTFPVTIYYAFKQSESEGTDGTASTGWETFLDAVIRAGFSLTGTWPMRTELSNRMVGSGTNALASSIVLVCRPRPGNAPTATRREFVNALKAELPVALAHLQKGNIAPVDLAQASIGPGMGIYTRYAQVLDTAGKPLTVREALALINQTLDEALAEQEGDFDADSRWALAWFEQQGFAEGEYGVAETLSKAKNTSVAGMVEAGILHSSRGKVRLLRPAELPADWDPATDPRLTAWETVHHLVRALESGGENAAAALVARLGGKAEVARELAYRLYVICERKKRAQEALSYNALVQSWPEVERLAREAGKGTVEQGSLFDNL